MFLIGAFNKKRPRTYAWGHRPTYPTVTYLHPNLAIIPAYGELVKRGLVSQIIDIRAAQSHFATMDFLSLWL